jgi:hypothetical protein
MYCAHSLINVATCYGISNLYYLNHEMFSQIFFFHSITSSYHNNILISNKPSPASSLTPGKSNSFFLSFPLSLTKEADKDEHILCLIKLNFYLSSCDDSFNRAANNILPVFFPSWR